MLRRTRIVATLGPATDRPGVLERLLDAGVDVARINFSHGSGEEPARRIQRVRELAAQRRRPIAVLADLPGPKLRVLLPAPLGLHLHQTVTLAVRAGVEADLQITEPDAAAEVRAGQRVLFDDGRIQGHVTAVTGGRATVAIDVPGTLLPNKGINLPDTDLAIPPVTQRDREALQVAVEAGVDWLALSFVRDAAAADALRTAVVGLGLDVPILAKIERPEAVRHSAEIIAAFDGIMVARGDLGVEIALEKVPHVQKHLINQARVAGKPVITATDMLDSMRANPRPTRAEASDVANAVFDGTDAIMLSGETAVGLYPVEAVACMHRIAIETETQLIRSGFAVGADVPQPSCQVDDPITAGACELARQVGARALVTPTLSGRTARMVAEYRPTARVVAVAPSEAVL
ncbi:MAG: pyruvate kinase, partial [Gemmataceae bacterium]|nr:pyruvate kinase [Gemmataceae bacterium]